MSSYGFLFPGQGSQKPGMGKEFYDTYESVREVFNRAEYVLPECSVKSICFEADEADLKKTENTQPALFTVSFAIYRVLSDRGIKGEGFAGHSLGEYTAVTAAGYLSFEDGLHIVRQRGILMRDCDPGQKGGMAAIIGVDEATIEEVCKEVGDVFPANFNSPNQIVISGMKKSVAIAAEHLKSRGARRTVVLNVGGPFHSPYMRDAAEMLRNELDRVQWERGNGRIVSNVTALVAKDPAIIKENLVKQLYNPVLWNSSLSTLLRMGYCQFIESGPGGVLKGLFKAHSADAEVFSVEKPEDLVKLKG